MIDSRVNKHSTYGKSNLLVQLHYELGVLCCVIYVY